MKKFFHDLNSLNRFICDIDLHRYKLRCDKCSSGEYFVAHDYIYIKQHNHHKKIVGRRLFCSNRYGRKGCGTTFRLYLASVIPKLKYTASEVTCFLESLLDNKTVQSAYKKATRSEDPRNAYRWLNKLYRALVNFRGAITRLTYEAATRHKYRTTRFNQLLPTIQVLFKTTDYCSCERFQTLRQKRFI